MKKTVNPICDKVSGDNMFQTISLNYSCNYLGLNVHSKQTSGFFSAPLNGKNAWPPAPLSQNSGLPRDREY